MPLPPVPIRTERLILRPWVDGDVDAMAAAIQVSVEHLTPWMPWAANEPLSREERLALIATFRSTWERGEDLTVGVFLEGTVVGGAGLHNRIGPSGLEIGYWIHVDHTRKGYATETAGALAGAALELAAVDHVWIKHDAANLASGGVPAKLGFTRIGEQHAEVRAPGETGVQWVWELR
jgi:ribosomal-protein-serine acetyltransferase